MSTRPAIFMALLAGIAARGAGADLLLVDRGEPRSVIVTADAPSPSARKAAGVLQEYIEKISGARLRVTTESASTAPGRVLVGHTAAARKLNVEIPSGFTTKLNEEGFVIRTVGQDLILAGNEDWRYRGTEIAVNKFLESLGCRWYFAGDYGEVVPTLRRIRVRPVDRTERPSFRLRNIWYSGWMTCTEEEHARFVKWCDLNNMSGMPRRLPYDGSVKKLVPDASLLESHPHIFALDKQGNRVPDMLCMTEPDAVKIAVRTITDYFREHPDAVTFAFAPPDGHPMCHGERCLAAVPGFGGKGYGDPSLSDLWFRFANKVATKVRKEFPDRWILTNGYANRVRLPEGIGSFSPNLGIQSAVIAACTLHRIGDPACWQRRSYRKLIDRWTEQLDWVFIYDYDPGKGLDGLPFPTLHCIRHDLPYLHRRGVWGFWTEGNNGWMITHLNHYVRARLMWNVNEDVGQIVRDYCEKFYGRAADDIERYMWKLEHAVERSRVHTTWGRLTPWKHILTSDVIEALDGAIADAERRNLEADARRRVDVLSRVHRHMKTYLDMVTALDDGAFRQASDLAARMLEMRDELARIDPSLIPHTGPPYREFRSTTEWHRDVYQGLADRAGGKNGELIAMLPRRWQFKPDAKDVGVLDRWYLPGRGEPWERIDVTTYWEAQGHQDAEGFGTWGKAWYRTRFQLSADAADRPLTLTLGAVYNRGLWVWVNGVLVAHHPEKHDVRTPLDIDVTRHLNPGRVNTVAILVNTPPPGRNPRGGLHRRVFVWSPRSSSGLR